MQIEEASLSADLRKILAILIIAGGCLVGMTAAAGFMMGDLSRAIPRGILGAVLLVSGAFLWKGRFR